MKKIKHINENFISIPSFVSTEERLQFLCEYLQEVLSKIEIKNSYAFEAGNTIYYFLTKFILIAKKS